MEWQPRIWVYPVGMENDFVILKLESPLELNNDVQAACLPDTGLTCQKWPKAKIESVILTFCWPILNNLDFP